MKRALLIRMRDSKSFIMTSYATAILATIVIAETSQLCSYEYLTNLGIHMKIATLNCRGLNKDEEKIHLIHESDNHRLNVTSLQEMKMKMCDF